MKSQIKILKTIILILALCATNQLSNAQWLTKASGFAAPQRGIQEMIAVNSNVLWALGYDSNDPTGTPLTDFTRTTDGGKNWTAGSMTAFPGYILIGIAPVSETTCYGSIFTFDNNIAKIVKTTDGGVTWTEKLSYDFGVSFGFFADIYFFNANEGLAYGDQSNGYFTIFTTSDGGNNWMRVPQANMPFPISTDEASYIFSAEGIGNTFWTVSTSGRVWKTTDKGLHWNAYLTPETFVDYSNLKMRDALHGLWGVRENLYRTMDGGITWTVVETSGTWFTNDLSYVPGTASAYVSTGSHDFDGYGAIHGIGSSYSLDDGNTWITIDTAVEHLSLAMINSYTGFTGGINLNGSAKGIYKYNGSALGYSCGNNMTSMCHNGHKICVENGSIPNHLSKGDNLGACSSRLATDETSSEGFQFSMYPNPVSGLATITFALSQSQHVSLKIFDMHGRLVSVLADKIFGAGVNELVWKSYVVNAGVYFLQLQTPGNLQTEKLFVVR
jgi:photosystem II stability/assembly factor-like uncharacterized protein